MKRLLVIRLGSLGDVILASPTVLNLSLGWPNSSITFLTRERYRPVVECMEGVDDIATVPDDIAITDVIRLAHQLDARNYDAVVDLHGNLRSWFIRKYLAAARTVSYPKRRWERYRLTKGVIPPGPPPHTIELYNSILEQLGCQAYARRPVLIPLHPPNSVENPREQPTQEGITVVIAPGAAHLNKQWPVGQFWEVAEQLHESFQCRIVWAVTSSDATEYTPWEQATSNYITTVIDYPLERLLPVVANADLTICNDSGIAHLSSAVGTPVVALFGPTHPALGFAPAGQFDRVVEVDEPCRPCSLHGKRPCHREERFCFTRISPDTVLAAAGEVIDRRHRRHRAVFVDRDGTLIVDKHYLSDPDEIEFEDGAVKALRRARQMGLRVVIVSNQSGVARGYFDIATVERLNARLGELLSAEGLAPDAVYFCPHYPHGVVTDYTQTCQCRKPAAGMPEQAAREQGIDLQRSWVVGDKLDDLYMSRVMGARAVLVRTGSGRQEEQRLRPSRFEDRCWVADNMMAAMDLIERVERSD